MSHKRARKRSTILDSPRGKKPRILNSRLSHEPAQETEILQTLRRRHHSNCEKRTSRRNSQTPNNCISHENIEFTLEKEKDGMLPFLDLLIKRNEGGSSFEIYRKPTDSPLCSPYDYKLAALLHRLYNIPLNEEGFQREINYIYSMGKLSGYKKDVLRRIQWKHEKRRDLGRITMVVREKKEKRKHSTTN
jgi:hypothetical protein